MEPLKIVVTGGAGFIGSALVRHLIKTTFHEVINVDNLTYAANLKSVEEVSDNPRYCFEQADICDSQQIQRIFKQCQPDIVFHLAAESHVDRSIAQPSDFIQTNIVGTFNLLDQSRAYLAEHPQKQNKFRFIHVSTDEVYGDLSRPGEVSRHSEPKNSSHEGGRERSEESQAAFTESSPYKPSSPYSASKAAADHLIQAWWRTYHLPGIIVHCSNNFGPYQFPEKLIPQTILNALQGRPIPIYGNGTQIRDWMYVEDTVAALLTIVEKGQLGETYNIGSQNEVKNIDLVRMICQILDELHPTVSAKSYSDQAISSYQKLISYVKDRPGHDRRYAINPHKIQSQLGWQSKWRFDDGLRKTVEFYVRLLSEG